MSAPKKQPLTRDTKITAISFITSVIFFLISFIFSDATTFIEQIRRFITFMISLFTRTDEYGVRQPLSILRVITFEPDSPLRSFVLIWGYGIVPIINGINLFVLINGMSSFAQKLLKAIACIITICFSIWLMHWLIHMGFYVVVLSKPYILTILLFIAHVIYEKYG